MFYRPGGTEGAALSIKRDVDRALRPLANCTTLASRYRVDRTTEGHDDIPKAYSTLLLNDIAATMPSMFGQPLRAQAHMVVALVQLRRLQYMGMLRSSSRCYPGKEYRPEAPPNRSQIQAGYG